MNKSGRKAHVLKEDEEEEEDIKKEKAKREANIASVY